MPTGIVILLLTLVLQRNGCAVRLAQAISLRQTLNGLKIKEVGASMLVVR